MDLLPFKAVPLETHDIKSGKLGAVSEHHSERNHIVFHARHSADEGMRADANPLMHSGKAAENGVILNRDVTRKRRVVDQDDVIADLAIVRYMSAGKKEAVAAHARDVAATLGAAIHRDVLAHGRVRADREPAFLTAVFLVLRRPAKDREWMDLAGLADFRFAGNDGMRVHLDARPDRDLGPDHRKRANLDASPKLCIRVYRR